MKADSERAKAHEGNTLKEKIWRVIFLSDSGSSRWFDITLLILIAASVLVVMLESVVKEFKMTTWWLTLVFR